MCFDNPYYRATGGVRIDRRPSELLGENLFVTVLDDDLGFEMIATGFRPGLADCSLFSTDYPHSVCLWPNSQDHIARLTTGSSGVAYNPCTVLTTIGTRASRPTTRP